MIKGPQVINGAIGGQKESKLINNNLCRACLEDVGYNYIDIQEDVLEKLKPFIRYNYAYPKRLCLDCWADLHKTSKFIHLIRHTDEILGKHFNIFDIESNDLGGTNGEYGHFSKTRIPIRQSDAQQDRFSEVAVATLPKTAAPLDFITAGDDTSESMGNTDGEYDYFSVSPIAISQNDTNILQRVNPPVDTLTNGTDSDAGITENDAGNDAIQPHSNNENDPDDPLPPKQHLCGTCMTSFKNENRLTLHLRDHEPPFICTNCYQVFKTNLKLVKHLKKHEVGERKFECSQCDKKYFSKRDLTVHERKHTGERPSACDVCEKSFADPRSLARHQVIHTGTKNYACTSCDKKFAHACTLRSHEKRHSGVKDFVCAICGFASVTSSQLTTHMRIHTLEKPFACEDCDKTFSRRNYLVLHKIKHTGERNHICTTCNKGLRTASDLKVHMRSHTGEKPFACAIPICNKRYKTMSSLSLHMKSHTGDKKYQCTVCNESFLRNSTLKYHSYTHTGYKPFSCTICGYKFTQKGALSAHLKRHNNS